MKGFYIVFLSMCVVVQVWSSDIKKVMQAVKTQESINVDGVLDDKAWQQSQIATNFIQNVPDPGEAPLFQTEVRFLYDDDGIYIGARLYDEHPELILKELQARDVESNSDRFLIAVDTYQDGINGFQFEVSAAGVQSDVKYSFSGEDSNWDAVWESEIKITDFGWVVEMKIPYQAIRFPEKVEQVWNIQFGREIRRIREISYWNEIDPLQEGFLNQTGQLEGIEDIKPPVRFTFVPFITTYLNTSYNPSATDGAFQSSPAYTAGMDMKLGLNDAFTLDMTLIPDFGQTISDNQVLNLTPFEVRFDENRQFFIEGTELFDKGGIFYSRRVGGRPLHYNKPYQELQDGERVVTNPDAASLYNASKISGRTSSGLGVGFFNAVSAVEHAVIRNSNGTERLVETSPLTNYNMIVLDQNLSNNSYVSLVNTNVMRDGSEYDANVSGLHFVKRNKEQSYLLGGGLNVTQRYFSDLTEIGHQLRMFAEKTKGNWLGGIYYLQESEDYNANDMGFVFSPNERSAQFEITYKEVKPKGNFISYRHNVSFSYSRLYEPNVFSDFAINLSTFYLMKSRFAFGVRSRLEPIETYDYFEPRTPDFSESLVWPRNFFISPWISSDYRRTFAIDASVSYRYFDYDNRDVLSFRIAPRLRLNDKASLVSESLISMYGLQPGYVSRPEESLLQGELQDDDILFGLRDRTVIENAISGKYIFNNKMSLVFRVRHYWDLVEYQSFATLDEEGDLDILQFNGMDDMGNAIYDRNFNIFNVDMNYIWRFAPGSDIIVNWKNQISGNSSRMDRNYFNNVGDLFNQFQQNSFSLKVVYWLDYNSLIS